LATQFWRLLRDVRPHERSRFLFFAVLAGLVHLALTLGITGSEALFLSRVGAQALPLAFVLASGVTVLGTLVCAALVGRTRNDVFFIRILVVGVLALAIAAPAAWLDLPGSLTAIFCIFFLTYAVYVNHYRTFIADYFDTLASKRLFPLFLIGQSFGGLLGGLLAVGITRVAPAELLIVAWAVVLAGAAVMLRVGRRPLRRWGPLELEEKDETSVEAIRGASRYILRSRLAQGLVISVLGMVLALFVSQYLYLEVFVRAFPDAEALALFIGVLLSVSNLAEIAVELWVTPRLIRRFGVASANLVHPALTLATFGALAWSYTLVPAVIARLNRELLEQALGEPVRTLVYNTIPLRFRGRLRMFLEGTVLYSGMAVAGLALLAIAGRLEPVWLAALGGGFATIYLLAHLYVRREYVRTLVTQLGDDRLDLQELGEELGRSEVARLASLWETLLEQTSSHPSQSELGLARLLIERGIAEPVLRAARHSNPRVRRACIDALASSPDAGVEGVLLGAISDPDPDVRFGVVQAILRRGHIGRELEEAVLRRLTDSDPDVRAVAALSAGARGLPVLRAMLDADHAADVVAALRRLPRDLIDGAIAHARTGAAEIRAEALLCLSQQDGPVPIDPQELARDLEHGDARVRRAVLVALGTHDKPEVHRLLAAGLADSHRDVRMRAAEALGAIGDPAIDVLRPYLRAEDFATAEAALHALAGVGSSRSRAVLTDELRWHVRESWRAHLALRVLPAPATAAERMLTAGLQDKAERNRRLAFLVLELREDARVMRVVDKVLRFAPARARADALEVLSNLGDREAARLLVLMLEDGGLEAKPEEIGPGLEIPRSSAHVLEAARVSPDPWVRLAAAAEHSPEQESLMERLLVLRQVPLLAGLSLDQLEAIGKLLKEVSFLAGEVICREGDLGSELYVLVDGEVNYYRNYKEAGEVLLNSDRPVASFGEMAIIGDAPRSATVVAVQDSTLLTLEGDRLKELILDVPDLAFPLFQVLSNRTRRAEDRLLRAMDAGQISPADA
jgi:HEAT repeat protein